MAVCTYAATGAATGRGRRCCAPRTDDDENAKGEWRRMAQVSDRQWRKGATCSGASSQRGGMAENRQATLLDHGPFYRRYRQATLARVRFSIAAIPWTAAPQAQPGRCAETHPQRLERGNGEHCHDPF